MSTDILRTVTIPRVSSSQSDINELTQKLDALLQLTWQWSPNSGGQSVREKWRTTTCPIIRNRLSNIRSRLLDIDNGDDDYDPYSAMMQLAEGLPAVTPPHFLGSGIASAEEELFDLFETILVYKDFKENAAYRDDDDDDMMMVGREEDEDEEENFNMYLNDDDHDDLNDDDEDYDDYVNGIIQLDIQTGPSFISETPPRESLQMQQQQQEEVPNSPPDPDDFGFEDAVFAGDPLLLAELPLETNYDFVGNIG